MNYTVRILPRAHADAREIARYLFKHSPQGMEAWLEAYEAVQARLANEPLTCGLAPEHGCIDQELREALFRTKRGRNYRALFFVQADMVYVLRVRGPGQQPLSRRDLIA